MNRFHVGKPRFSARMAADTLMPAGFNTIPWDVFDMDDVGGWDPVTDAYVLDRPGLWLVHLQCRRLSTLVGGSLRVAVYINDIEVGGFATVSTTAATGAAVEKLLELAEADEVKWRVRLHTTIDATLSAADTQGFLVRIGPKRWV